LLWEARPRDENLFWKLQSAISGYIQTYTIFKEPLINSERSRLRSKIFRFETKSARNS